MTENGIMQGQNDAASVANADRNPNEAIQKGNPSLRCLMPPHGSKPPEVR